MQAWSKTANSNASADSSINWAEGQDPGSVNNSARSVMAAVKKLAEDTGGGLVAGGTGNAITLTTNQVLSSAHVAAGLTLKFRATATNTGATTINVDSTGAVSCVNQYGQALTGGEIISGGIFTVAYNANTSKWVLLTPAGVKPCFAAYKGSNQTITANPTKITFTTEELDAGGYYDASNSKWTPPAGVVFVEASAQFTDILDGTLVEFLIYKNGSSVARCNRLCATTDALRATYIGAANGTDYFEVYVACVDPSWTVYGIQAATRFTGTML